MDLPHVVTIDNNDNNDNNNVVIPVVDDVNPLYNFFLHHTEKKVDKWLQYFDVYHQHFQRFRGKPVNILEIGVQNGGSLQMWREYFGDQCKIWGVDIDPACKAHEAFWRNKYQDDNISVIIGDQGDRGFLKGLVKSLPAMDIIIDDGGHQMHQQIASFEELYPSINPGGVYLVEDTHTSYWPSFGSGLLDERSFIEYSKHKLDELNGWHYSNGPTITNITNNTAQISFNDSIVTFTKKTYRQFSIGRPRREVRLLGVSLPD